MEIWKRIARLLIPIYPRTVYTWGAVLWAVVQDKPMVYDQEDVANALAMRRGLTQKTFLHLHSQLETDKPKIW